MKFSFKQERFGDFSGGAVEGSPPANAGGMGSIPDLGAKLPQDLQQGQTHTQKWKKWKENAG